MIRSARLRGASAIIVAVASLFAGTRPEAHKPITSPYTFNEDVFPILQTHCGRCHVAGGVAPMSLMTHAETVPWGESIRLEVIAGHMPPWTAETTSGRFRHTPHLSARELDTLLTWASGGTPIGDESKPPAPVVLDHGWRLGRPDVERALPEFTLGADAQEQTAEFVVPGPPADGPRALRAVDLMPGTPAMVRSATIQLRSPANSGAVAGPPLLIWQPGDEPLVLDDGAFVLPAGAELVVRIRYKKTWEHEGKAMTDRSAIGLYAAFGAPPTVEALSVRPPGLVLERGVRVLAVAPDPSLTDTDIRLETVAPDGTRALLIAFRPRADWTRRYRFDTPVSLPRGTRLGMSVSARGQVEPRLMLDVVASY